MLTAKQRELLLLIHHSLLEDGVSPSYEEMKETLGLRSKSGVHRLIRALEERGFIRRLPNRARALEVLRLPDSSTPPRRFTPSVIKGGRSELLAGASFESGADSGSVPIPVMGQIAAGTPIEALQICARHVAFPEAMLRAGNHYALEVEGDSMIGAGIFSGDTVILQETDSALSGDIVVALIDDREATLKRLRQKGASIALEAANPSYETRILPPERVRIQGKLIGLFRKY